MKRPKRKSPAEIEREEFEKQLAERRAEHEAEIEQRQLEEREANSLRADKVEARTEQYRIDHEARKQLISEVTRQRPFELPPVGWTAEDFLAEDSEPPEAVIEQLHYRGNNTLLVAEHKTGKTTLEISLAAALADDKPFLNKYPVHMPYGKIAFLNYEMDSRMFRHWLNECEIENVDRIVPLNLRGWQLPFWNEDEMLRLADWLLQNQVGFIILDPASKAWRGLVESENDNTQLAEFFGALDELKRLGDVSNLLISVHKPRSQDDRARGGGEIEAWPDANWYMNKRKDGIRTLRAEGRDVVMDETDLEFNEKTRMLSLGAVSEERQLNQGIESAVAALEAFGPMPSASSLSDHMKGVANSAKRTAIRAAVTAGLIIEERDGNRKRYLLPGQEES